MQPSNLPEVIKELPDLSRFKLVWDVNENGVTTFTKTRKIGDEVYKLLRSNNIKVLQMESEHRILYIYFHAFFINPTKN